MAHEDDLVVLHGEVGASVSEELVEGVELARGTLMDELCGLARTLVAAMEENPGFVPCGHAFAELVEGTYAATSSDSEEELMGWARAARARSEHVSEHRGVAAGPAVFPVPDGAEEALLFAAARGLSADAVRALRVGRPFEAAGVALAEALAALGGGEVDHALLVRVGRAAYALDEAGRA